MSARLHDASICDFRCAFGVLFALVTADAGEGSRDAHGQGEEGIRDPGNKVDRHDALEFGKKQKIRWWFR